MPHRVGFENCFLGDYLALPDTLVADTLVELSGNMFTKPTLRLQGILSVSINCMILLGHHPNQPSESNDCETASYSQVQLGTWKPCLCRVLQATGLIHNRHNHHCKQIFIHYRGSAQLALLHSETSRARLAKFNCITLSTSHLESTTDHQNKEQWHIFLHSLTHNGRGHLPPGYPMHMLHLSDPSCPLTYNFGNARMRH